METVKFVRTAALSLAAVSLILGGCSAEDRSEADETLSGVAGSASSVASSVGVRAGDLFDDAKVGTFVAAFRAQFGALAEDRDDTAIRNLLTSTCTEISSGTDEASVIAQLEIEAASGDSKPSTEQAQRIYDQAKLACP